MNLSVSFSGGKTSAYMSKLIKNNLSKKFKTTVYTFANTGQENEETLEFVNRCDKEWGLNVAWLEADVNPQKGVGTGFKIVNYETASRNGEPFEAYIKKHGIPNQSHPKCTSELKTTPMRAYLRSLGWKKGTYKTAIGIRADEHSRVNANYEKENLIYPLIQEKITTKENVNNFFEKQSFNLCLQEHQGNCKWCWKKSDRKLLTLAADTPEIFEFPARMEKEHRFAGPYPKELSEHKGRVFFRNNRSALDILELSKKPFVRWTPNYFNADIFDADMDTGSGFSESCEVY